MSEPADALGGSLPAGANELDAARAAAARAAMLVQQAGAFQDLPLDRQTQLLADLATVERAFSRPSDPYAFALAEPLDRRRNPLLGLTGQPEQDQPPSDQTGEESTSTPRPPATEAIAARAGALLDEIDFPSFVAGLVHGTFDAVVDASIRQLEAFADLVGSVATTADRFTSDNVTENQARDWLVEQYPADLHLLVPADGAPRPTLVPRPTPEGEPRQPAWLADFGLREEDLTEELIDEQLVPQARRRLGDQRLQTLATMVLLGMNRVVVSDGSISAKLRFRAAARDRAEVDFAVAQDPGANSWGTRGSAAYQTHSTMVSTVGVNAQTDAMLSADLFGEVRINFASETLPLEQFADAAQRALLQRNARWQGETPAASQPVPAPAPAVALPAPAPAPPAPAPAPPAPAAPEGSD